MNTNIGVGIEDLIKFLTIPQALRMPFRWLGRGKNALIDANTDRKITYEKLESQVTKIANTLLSWGLERGDVISPHLTNRLEHPIWTLAPMYAGLVTISVRCGLPINQLILILNSIKCKVLIFDEIDYENIQKAREELRTVKKYIYIGEKDRTPDWAVNYNDLLSHGSDTPLNVDIKAEDDVWGSLTGGTSGIPKVFMRKHLPILVSTWHYHYLLGPCTTEDVYLLPIPYAGSIGVTTVNAILWYAGTNVLMDFHPVKWLENVAKYKVTVGTIVPTMGKMILDYKPENYDLSSLKKIIFIGAPLPNSLYEEFRERVCSGTLEFIGSQDVGFFTHNTPELKRNKPRSVGVPSPFSEIKIVDPEGNEVGPNKTGELLIRSAGMFNYYYNNPEKTSEIITEDKWAKTGDLFYQDEDGFLYVTGRRTDLIITGGYNVEATGVEDVLHAHDKVRDAIVVGLPHETWGEAVTAFVSLKDDYEENRLEEIRDELLDICKAKLHKYAMPRKLIFVDSIPRSNLGKVEKFKMIEKYQELYKTEK